MNRAQPGCAGVCLSALLLLALGGEATAGPPHRTRAEKISDQTYRNGVRQRKKAIDRNRSRLNSPSGFRPRKRKRRMVSLASRCATLTRVGRARRVSFSRLQDAILPFPPGIPPSRWNGMTIPARVKWYGRKCSLSSAMVDRLLRRSPSSSSRTRYRQSYRPRRSHSNRTSRHVTRRHRNSLTTASSRRRKIYRKTSTLAGTNLDRDYRRVLRMLRTRPGEISLHIALKRRNAYRDMLRRLRARSGTAAKQRELRKAYEQSKF